VGGVLDWVTAIVSQGLLVCYRAGHYVASRILIIGEPVDGVSVKLLMRK
jgi:hypothetical protein